MEKKGSTVSVLNLEKTGDGQVEAKIGTSGYYNQEDLPSKLNGESVTWHFIQGRPPDGHTATVTGSIKGR